MSNLYYLINRSVSRLKPFSFGSPNKLLITKRGITCVINGRCVPERKVITRPASTPTKGHCSSYTAESRLRLNEDNILSSSFENVEVPREFLHQFVWKNFQRWANKTATICATSGKSYTYSQLRTLSGKFASSLRKFKFYPGDTIGVILPNVIEYPIILLGASEAGVRVTMSNPISTAKEISRQLINSEALAVITTPQLYSVVKDSINGNSNIKVPIIVLDSPNDSVPDGTIRFSELIADSVEAFSESLTPDRNNEETMFLPYSSGTTGLPKGVELSHRNIIVNCKQYLVEGLHAGYETTETHQDVVPVILPLFHIYGLSVVLLKHLSYGAKLVFLRQFNPEGFLTCLKDFKSNLLYVAPPLVLYMASSELVTSHHLENLRLIVSGAAPIGANSVRRLLSKANHDISFSQGYGLTETSPLITVSKNGMDNLDAAGFLVSNTEVRFVGIDEHNVGRNMGLNETGELYVKGPQVMKGYFKNPEATANTMDGEWFKTGDIGCYDEAGHIFIKDRLKELIKVKGFQVPPAELEELLLSNDGILDVGVTAEPHPRFGEIPKAFVVRKPGSRLDEDAVKNFVAERVPNYKQLGLVKFVDVIPKSSAGKILRRQLKDL